MSIEQLKEQVFGLTQDVSFVYNGKNGLVMPYSRNKIILCYGDSDIECTSPEMAMTYPFFDGQSLAAIANKANFD
ncbi:MAG: hypothetical protein AAGU74_09525 [Bacillota bacterium]